MKFPASALILVFMLSVAAHGAGRPASDHALPACHQPRGLEQLELQNGTGECSSDAFHLLDRHDDLLGDQAPALIRSATPPHAQ